MNNANKTKVRFKCLLHLKQIEAELTQLHTVTVTGRKNPGVSVVMPSLSIVAHRVVEDYIQKLENTQAQGT